MSMSIIILLGQLFWTFFVIGMFTFGGGYAMLSLIQAQVVTSHAWISQSTFADIVAISQMTPGPIGINCATFVGYDVLQAAGASPTVSILGSLATTMALVLPSFIIMMILVKFYIKFSRNLIFEGVMAGVRPAVVGLIGAAALVMMINVVWAGMVPSISLVSENFQDWKSWALFGAAAVASLRFRINPIWIIVAGAILGLIIY